MGHKDLSGLLILIWRSQTLKNHSHTWERKSGGGSEGENLKQTLHWALSLMQDSTSQSWDHNLSEVQELNGHLTNCVTQVLW